MTVLERRVFRSMLAMAGGFLLAALVLLSCAMQPAYARDPMPGPWVALAMCAAEADAMTVGENLVQRTDSVLLPPGCGARRLGVSTMPPGTTIAMGPLRDADGDLFAIWRVPHPTDKSAPPIWAIVWQMRALAPSSAS